MAVSSSSLSFVNHAYRNVRGVAEPLDQEERLANLISDQISPRLVPQIEILPWRQTQVLALQVYPSPSRPHHLIREGPAAGVYVRVGSTNRRADGELIEGAASMSTRAFCSGAPSTGRCRRCHCGTRPARRRGHRPALLRS